MGKKSQYSMVVAADYALVSPGNKVDFGNIQARQLLWNRKGHGIIIVNGEKYFLRGLDFILCPYFSEVSYYNSGESVWNIGGICIVLDVLDRDFFNAFYGAQTSSGENKIHRNCEWKNFEMVKVGTLAENRILESLFEYTMQFYKSKSLTSTSLHNLALLLIEGLEDHFERRVEQKVLLPQFQLMLEEADQLENPNIDKLCRIFCCSRSTLFRKFKEHLNFSPHQWIIGKKLQYSAELLYQTDLPVKQVAQNSGFEDENYFTRIFRKKYSVSPIAYRRRNSMFGRKF